MWYCFCMEVGFEKTKRFFSNKDFKWFDRKEVRGETSLSPEDLKYIKGWTISPFGWGYIFYIGLRKLPDIFTIYIITYIYAEISSELLAPLVSSAESLILSILYFLISSFLVIISLYAWFFTFRHGRRLSWNRGRSTVSVRPKTIQWKSVEELKKSEKKWFYFNTIPSTAFLALLSFTFFDKTSDFVFDYILFNPIFFSGFVLLVLGVLYPLYIRNSSKNQEKVSLTSKKMLVPIIISIAGFLAIVGIYLFGGDILNISPF
jgi:uncharacterized membrane protein (DUF441 family)